MAHPPSSRRSTDKDARPTERTSGRSVAPTTGRALRAALADLPALDDDLEVDIAAIEYDTSRSWCVEDLLGIADERHRYEIADGVLEVTPMPALGHQQAANLICRRLNDGLPRDLMCGVDLGIAIGRSYRVPDFAIVQLSSNRPDRLTYMPTDVLMIGEVVSPSSRANDRFVKRVEYAAARIPLYVRIELDEAAIVVDVLDAGRGEYRHMRTFHPGETIELTEPLPLRIAVDDVLG